MTSFLEALSGDWLMRMLSFSGHVTAVALKPRNLGHEAMIRRSGKVPTEYTILCVSSAYLVASSPDFRATESQLKTTTSYSVF